jgi:ATP synthase subunit 6
MIPYSFTVTSHIVVTLALAMMAFFSINIVAIKTHGFHFLSFFLPPGAPLALAPLLVGIEIVSYSFRVVSLALRLFANMMSGHCLLKILAGFA